MIKKSLIIIGIVFMLSFSLVNAETCDDVCNEYCNRYEHYYTCESFTHCASDYGLTCSCGCNWNYGHGFCYAPSTGYTECRGMSTCDATEGLCECVNSCDKLTHACYAYGYIYCPDQLSYSLETGYIAVQDWYYYGGNCRSSDPCTTPPPPKGEGESCTAPSDCQSNNCQTDFDDGNSYCVPGNPNQKCIKKTPTSYTLHNTGSVLCSGENYFKACQLTGAWATATNCNTGSESISCNYDGNTDCGYQTRNPIQLCDATGCYDKAFGSCIDCPGDFKSTGGSCGNTLEACSIACGADCTSDQTTYSCSNGDSYVRTDTCGLSSSQCVLNTGSTSLNQDCSTFNCNSANGLCYTSCSGPNECASGYYCESDTCHLLTCDASCSGTGCTASITETGFTPGLYDLSITLDASGDVDHNLEYYVVKIDDDTFETYCDADDPCTTCGPNPRTFTISSTYVDDGKLDFDFVTTSVDSMKCGLSEAFCLDYTITPVCPPSITPISAPSMTSATQNGAGTLAIAWSGTLRDTYSYYSLARNSGGGDFSMVHSSAATSYSDTGLADGTEYCYKALINYPKGDCGILSTGWSNTVCGTTCIAAGDAINTCSDDGDCCAGYCSTHDSAGEIMEEADWHCCADGQYWEKGIGCRQTFPCTPSPCSLESGNPFNPPGAWWTNSNCVDSTEACCYTEIFGDNDYHDLPIKTY